MANKEEIDLDYSYSYKSNSQQRKGSNEKGILKNTTSIKKNCKLKKTTFKKPKASSQHLYEVAEKEEMSPTKKKRKRDSMPNPEVFTFTPDKNRVNSKKNTQRGSTPNTLTIIKKDIDTNKYKAPLVTEDKNIKLQNPRFSASPQLNLPFISSPDVIIHETDKSPKLSKDDYEEYLRLRKKYSVRVDSKEGFKKHMTMGAKDNKIPSQQMLKPNSKNE